MAPTMDAVKQLMEEAGWGYLATTDGSKAAVRPMGGWAFLEGELWCATFVESDKVKEVRAVPHAEYCFSDKEGKHVRISGPTSVSIDQTDKDRLYELRPGLERYIPDANDPNYGVLRTRVERVRIMASTDMKYTEVDPKS